jgi:pimeloyl-ACP methyl ester carboxylesterase
VTAYVDAALAADPIRVDWREQQQFAELDPTKVRVPTLVLHGERDPLTPLVAQARLFTQLGNPDRRWIILAGGDHAALVEDTQPAFIAAIVSFLERPQ